MFLSVFCHSIKKPTRIEFGIELGTVLHWYCNVPDHVGLGEYGREFLRFELKKLSIVHRLIDRSKRPGLWSFRGKQRLLRLFVVFWIKNLWMGNLLHFYRTMRAEESLVLNKISASVRWNSLRNISSEIFLEIFPHKSCNLNRIWLHISCGHSMHGKQWIKDLPHSILSLFT